MHEMALCESIVQILETEAKRQSFARVRSVRVEVGALSHVEPQALEFCFDAVSRGTLAEGARFEILTTEGQAWCLDCEQSVAIAMRYDPCPGCGGHRLQVTGGEELKIKDLEVD